jgi:hypothetical protein
VTRPSALRTQRIKPARSLIQAQKNTTHLPTLCEVAGQDAKGTWRVAGGLYRIRIGQPLASGSDPEWLRETSAAAVAKLLAEG